MIYRDERHQHTFEKESAMRPESISRPLLAGLYLLTADRNLWNQVKDHISLRRVYVEDMRPKNLTGASYVYFAAAKDIPERLPKTSSSRRLPTRLFSP